MKYIMEYSSMTTYVQAWRNPLYRSVGGWVLSLQPDGALADQLGGDYQGRAEARLCECGKFRSGMFAVEG